MGVLLVSWLSVFAIPILVYLAFAVPALYHLRSRPLDDVARAVWALAIVGVPVMGAVAFAVLNPGIKAR